MNKAVAIFGVLAVGGGLSICDLCDTNPASQRASTREFMSVASAGMPGGSARKETPRALMLTVPATKLVTLRIEGMTCGGCVFGVRTALRRLPGVSKADVSYEKGRAVVTYDPKLVTTAQMIAAIKTLGYSATIDALLTGP